MIESGGNNGRAWVAQTAAVGRLIADTRAAGQAVLDAGRAFEEARAARRDEFQRLWPRLARLGATEVSRRLGEEVAGSASTLLGYARGLTPRRRRGPVKGARDLVLTDDEEAALGEYERACLRLRDADRAYRAALHNRDRMLRRLWPEVAHLGPSALASELQTVQEWTIRHAVSELRWEGETA